MVQQSQEQSSVTETGSHRDGEGGDGWGEWDETSPKLVVSSRNKLVAQPTKSRGMKLHGQQGSVSEKQQLSHQRVREADHQGTTAPVESRKTPVVPQVQSPESGGGEGTKSPPLATSTPSKPGGKTQVCLDYQH